jgi:hypothetical protein
LVVFFFFQKKKQKALVLLRRNRSHTHILEADPGGLEANPQRNNRPVDILLILDLIALFFFQKKKQKAFVLLRRKRSHTHTSAKPTLGVWGLAPKKQSICSYPLDTVFSGTLLFPEEKGKSVCS